MKSDNMREDELNRAVEEDAKELAYLYAYWKNYDNASAESMSRMKEKHRARQLAANERVRRQAIKDENGLIGLAGCLFVVACPLLGFGFWLSNTCGTFECVWNLFGW